MEFVFDNIRPIYIQLVEQLERYIISGVLKPAAKLPSVRELALMTKTNPNTVQKALERLEILGLIYTERTNGKFVTDDVSLIKNHKEKYARTIRDKYLADMRDLGFETAEAIDYLNSLGGKNE